MRRASITMSGTWTIATGTAVNFQRLTGPQWQALQKALLAAFPVRGQLQQLVQFYLNENLDAISGGGGLSQDVFNLIQWTQARGSTEQLFRAAAVDNPGNPDLVAFRARVGAPETPQLAEEIAASKLQKALRERVPMLDLPKLLERLGKIQRCVCRVELAGRPAGTGFLVGNRAVLTNHHVLARVIDGSIAPSKVVLRFDFAEGFAGTTFALDLDDWLIDKAPPAPFEDADLRGGTPADAELDYAVVRLKGTPGAAGAAGDASSPQAPPRGFIVVPGGAPAALMVDDPLYVVQHPAGAPIKIAIETHGVIQYNDNNTRLQHAVNTEPGSSGSPVFDLLGNLVGLHHAGDTSANPPFNQAVPIGAIRALMEQRGTWAALAE